MQVYLVVECKYIWIKKKTTKIGRKKIWPNIINDNDSSENFSLLKIIKIFDFQNKRKKRQLNFLETQNEERRPKEFNTQGI